MGFAKTEVKHTSNLWFLHPPSDEERDTFLESLSAADDWLFDQEMDAPAKIFEDKLNGLKKDFTKFFKRLHEKQQRPRVIAELLNHLNQSEHFYSKSAIESKIRCQMSGLKK